MGFTPEIVSAISRAPPANCCRILGMVSPKRSPAESHPIPVSAFALQSEARRSGDSVVFPVHAWAFEVPRIPARLRTGPTFASETSSGFRFDQTPDPSHAVATCNLLLRASRPRALPCSLQMGSSASEGRYDNLPLWMIDVTPSLCIYRLFICRKTQPRPTPQGNVRCSTINNIANAQSISLATCSINTRRVTYGP